MPNRGLGGEEREGDDRAPPIPQSGRTALHLAAIADFDDIASRLLADPRVDPNLQDKVRGGQREGGSGRGGERRPAHTPPARPSPFRARRTGARRCTTRRTRALAPSSQLCSQTRA